MRKSDSGSADIGIYQDINGPGVEPSGEYTEVQFVEYKKGLFERKGVALLLIICVLLL